MISFDRLAFSAYLLINLWTIDDILYNTYVQIIGKELFSVLREKWGAEFDSFIAEKVVALPGDVTFENLLGMSEPRLMAELCNETQIIVNSAATTNFDER